MAIRKQLKKFIAQKKQFSMSPFNPIPDEVAAAYKLRENPFGGRFQATLLPEADTDLDQLYVSVDGLSKALAQIDGWIAGLKGVDRVPRIALISGPKGSGRSSTANYVAYRCAAALNATGEKEKQRFSLLQQSFVTVEIFDEHEVAPVKEMVHLFFLRALELGVSLPESISSRLLEMISEPNVRPTDFYRVLYTMLRTVTKLVVKVPIFCLEHVRNIKQILAATSLSGSDSILLCTTTLDTVANDFAIETTKGGFYPLKMDLTGLGREDVLGLIEQRWKAFGQQGSSPPIPKCEIEAAAWRLWPMRGVVLILDQILSMHARRSAASPDLGVTIVTRDEINEGIIEVLSTRGAEFRG